MHIEPIVFRAVIKGPRLAIVPLLEVTWLLGAAKEITWWLKVVRRQSFE